MGGPACESLGGVEREPHQHEMAQLQRGSPTPRENLLNRLRIYQSWEGRNFFCCGGRLMTGPEPLHLAASVLLIVGPCLLFYYAVLPLVPFERQLTCSVFVGALLILCLALLFIVAFTDPGIIPRGREARGDRAEERVVNGCRLTLRWCSTCQHYRPPRAKHCSICDNCVAAFDHHCPWSAGRSRLARFVLWRQAEVARAGLPLGLSSIWLVLTTRRAVGFEAACCLTACLPLLNLLGFNGYLISQNLTTAEEFSRPYGDLNPFSEGCKTNCYRFWCSRVAPRAVDFRGLVETPLETPHWQQPLAAEEAGPRTVDPVV
ncbi:hypothetical protein ACSSS7_006988 [Eimeria intestinalis]